MSGTTERMVIHIGTHSFHLGRRRSIIRSRFDKLSFLSGTVFFKYNNVLVISIVFHFNYQGTLYITIFFFGARMMLGVVREEKKTRVGG